MTLTADWTDADISAYLDFCEAVETPCDVPLQVWANESDNKASAHNPNGDASGIFQLMPATAKGLGYDVDHDPHLATYRGLGISGQLPWAARFYGAHKGDVSTVARFYLCTFLPALLHCGDDLSHVLAGRNGPMAWVYVANKLSFDPMGTGFITVGQLVDAAHRATGPRTRELMDRVADAKRDRDTQPGA